MHRSIRALAIIGIVAAWCGCAPGAHDARIVRFGVDANGLGTQVWVAKDRGDFARYGIVPQIVVFPLGTDALDAVLTGRVDMAVAIDFATATRLRSRQIEIVAAVMQPESGFHKLAVGPTIHVPADLVGKRIGIVRGTSQSFVTTEYLRRHGIPLDRVTLVGMQDLFDEVAALRAHRLDAAFVWANGTDQAQRIAGVHILEDDTSAGVHFYGYLTTGERYARDHAPQIVASLRALTDATRFMERHLHEAATIAAAHSTTDADTMESMIRSQHYIVALTPANRASFVTMTAFASTREIVPVALDPAGAFHDAYLRTANPAADTLR
jgi:NitT/TauT family transport system substrate-binding protein